MPKKFKDAYEESNFMRSELKRLMALSLPVQEIRSHFLSFGIDRSHIDIIVSQTFKDAEKRNRLLALGKKFYRVSLVFLLLFLTGVAGWFYFWGDWITYFAGINFVVFLFFLLKGNTFRGEAEVYMQ